ncbi:hypothetical protein D1007_51400 [Hordeum vulgare]|nr:hypothetical protein D1007_51400 [Hordeum vulgare]
MFDEAERVTNNTMHQPPFQTGFSRGPILSSCVRPLKQQESNDPVVLLHGFDRYSSCLEWRYTYPLLEEAGLEAWAVDILGWGFSNLETRPPSDVLSKRQHLYQVEHKCLVLWGEDDEIISNKQAYRLHKDLPNAILRQDHRK